MIINKAELGNGRFSQEIVIDQGVSQGSSPFPMLFNMCIYMYGRYFKIIKKEINAGIKLLITVNMLFSADNMVILQEN
jgi:hypothetical protein